MKHFLFTSLLLDFFSKVMAKEICIFKIIFEQDVTITFKFRYSANEKVSQNYKYKMDGIR